MPSNASQANVLIVGAGAMGLTLGYHLHLAGAQIVFLVRPSRRADLSRPQILYSYDDDSLKTFSEFRVITAPDMTASPSPDYVIVTLDGPATTSPEGTELLRALGTAIGTTAAVMIGCGVGVGLREHYLDVTEMLAKRVMMGVLGSFAYQVSRANLPLHPPTDSALLAQADVAYRHYSKNGFMVEGSSPDIAKGFAALYDRNGMARCAVLEPHLYAIFTNIPFPIYAGNELLDWPPVSDLTTHTQVWRTTVRAVQEIAQLRRHGWRGKTAGLLLTEWMVAKMWKTIDKKCRPLDFQAFNAFHHGAKVAAQDREIMQKCLAAGEAEGKPMTALKELLQRLASARVDNNQ